MKKSKNLTPEKNSQTQPINKEKTLVYSIGVLLSQLLPENELIFTLTKKLTNIQSDKRPGFKELKRMLQKKI